jgi:hypothetical protein
VFIFCQYGAPVILLNFCHQISCSELLLSLGQTHAAFSLCSEHLYCDGLMQSTYQDPSTLLPRLVQVLRDYGNSVSTDTAPLATACFAWLEQRHRPADILSLGDTNRPLLVQFLHVRILRWSRV